jgi:Tfp pilus assembly protein PilF
MSFASVKSSGVTFLISAGLNGFLFAQIPDPFQPDIPAPLVAKVDDAKEKQANNKDLPAAEAELQDVLKQRPDYYRALFNLGLVYQAQGKSDQALQTLEKAKGLRDNLHISDSSILNSIGWAYMTSGKFDEAESNFLAGLKEGHEDTVNSQRLLNNLGYLYLQKGDTAKSRLYLQRAINEYHSTGAQRLLQMDDEYDEREKALEQKVLRTFPKEFLERLGGHDIDAVLRYFEEPANYYDSGKVSRSFIRKDLERDDKTWPKRSYSLNGDPKVTKAAERNTFTLEFPMAYSLTNERGTANGLLQMTMRVRIEQGAVVIVDVQKQVIRAHKPVNR